MIVLRKTAAKNKSLFKQKNWLVAYSIFRSFSRSKIFFGISKDNMKFYRISHLQ